MLVSLLGVAGKQKGGGADPLIGVLSSDFCMTRRGVLSSTTSPPSTTPGDLGSTSSLGFLTGVSQDLSTAMGVLSSPSEAERGSDLRIRVLNLSASAFFLIIFNPFLRLIHFIHLIPFACYISHDSIFL